MVPLFSSLRTRSSADCHCFEQLCVEYKESNNNEITSSAEKVVRPWPDRPDRRLRPCLANHSQFHNSAMNSRKRGNTPNYEEGLLLALKPEIDRPKRL